MKCLYTKERGNSRTLMNYSVKNLTPLLTEKNPKVKGLNKRKHIYSTSRSIAPDTCKQHSYNLHKFLQTLCMMSL